MSDLWRCPDCGTEYVKDVGRCVVIGCPQPLVLPLDGEDEGHDAKLIEDGQTLDEQVASTRARVLGPADGEQPAGLCLTARERHSLMLLLTSTTVSAIDPLPELESVLTKLSASPGVGPVSGGLTQTQARRIEDVLEELDVDGRSWSQVEREALAVLRRLAEGAE